MKFAKRFHCTADLCLAGTEDGRKVVSLHPATIATYWGLDECFQLGLDPPKNTNLQLVLLSLSMAAVQIRILDGAEENKTFIDLSIAIDFRVPR